MTKGKPSKTKTEKAKVELENLIKEIYSKIEEAQKFADKNNLFFDLSITYGMGGTYYGQGTGKIEYDYKSKDYEERVRKEGEWISSTQACR